MGKAATIQLEADFLQAVLAASDQADRRRSVRGAYRPELDWDGLARTAVRNRVFPLFYSRALACGDDIVPREVRERLDLQHLRAKCFGLLLTRELLRLIDRFEDHGVEVLPYKGPVLGKELYGDVALRQFADLDVLVQRAAVPEATRLLRDLGYERQAGEEDVDPEAVCEVHLENEQNGVLVELHWDILPARHAGRLATEELWERSRSMTFEGRRLRAFLPEDLLLVLCAHAGEKHRWMRLQWVCDVTHLLVAYPDLDWDRCLEHADRAGQADAVLLGVLLAWALQDAPLPARILERASRTKLTAQVGIVQGRVLREDGGLPTFAEWYAFQRAVARRKGGAAGRRGMATGWLSYARAVLSPDWTDREQMPLPRALRFLHYLYRPLRLLRRHGLGLVRRLGAPTRGKRPPGLNASEG